MKKRYLWFLVIIVLFSCSNGRISDLTHDPDEAIVTGIYRVLYNGRDVTPLSSLFFNESFWGIYRYHSRDNLIATKLPLGRNCIAGVSFEGNNLEFSHDYFTFDLENGEVANSLGYFEIRLYGSARRANVNAPMTEINFSSGNSGAASIRTEYTDEIEKDIETKFRRRFNSDIQIKKVEIKIDSFYSPYW